MGSAIALLYLAVIVGLLIWHPRTGFLGLFLLRPFVELSRAFPGIAVGNFSLAQVIGIVVPTVLVVVMLIRMRGRLPLPLTVLALVAWFSVPALFGGPGNVELWLRLVTPLPLLLFPQVVVWTDEQRIGFVRAIFWSVPIVGLSMVIGFAFPAFVPNAVTIGDAEVVRLAGVFRVPTLTAYWLSIFIVVCVFLFVADRSSRWRLFYLAMATMLLFPLYATFGRTAWVAVVLSLGLWLWLRGSRKGVAVLAAVSIVALLSVSGVRDRLFAENWGGTSRMVLWQPAFAMYQDASIIEKLFGVGWGNLNPRIWKYLPAGFPFEGTGTTENSLLFLVFGGGILAAASYLVFTADVARRLLIRIRLSRSGAARDYAALALAILALMWIQGMTGDVVTSPVLVWYFYAMIGVAMTPRILSQPAPA